MAVIELDGLSKDYGDVLANDDLTFAVESGEIFGYLGPNGAGKTTTIRTLLGFIKPTSGTARVLGTNVQRQRELVETKRRIGYLSDEPGFDEQATGAEVIDLHGSVKGDARSEELLELFDPPLDRPIREYSSGNVQKLGLVTTFMHDPDLVILDEPTSGLDPLMKQRFAEFLRSERDDGVTVFFSSHILSEVRRLCNRVGIIRQGKLVAIEPIETLLQRSGKVVRVVGAEPIPVAAVDVDGVHDLTTSLQSDAAEDGEADYGEDGDADAGADDKDGENGEDGEVFTECAFTFTGDVNALLDRLAGYDLLDVAIEEAPLEDVFLKFYGGEDGV